MKKHLAIFSKGYIAKILTYQKTIESRFSKVRCAPYHQVEVGDIILLKEQSGPIRAKAEVKDVVYYSGLTPKKVEIIKREYNDRLKACEEFWEEKKKAKYGTLLFLGRVEEIPPRSYRKGDRRGWVVLSSKSPTSPPSKQLLLFGNNHNVSSSKSASVSPDGECQNGLHSFTRSPIRNKKAYPCCRNCGADIVDWEELHRRNIGNLNSTIGELRKEKLRNDWWKKQVDLRAQNHALRKGEVNLRKSAQNRIKKSVGTKEPYRDGYQTPYKGNVIYYAQHALACCCRKCIECWHGIPQGRELTDEEIDYFTDLVMTYVRAKMPSLIRSGIYVPPIKNRL